MALSTHRRQEFCGRMKFFTAGTLQLKPRTFDNGGGAQAATTLMGYPICWGALSSDRGGYSVRVRPGAANFTAPVMALFHHDFQNVLGSTQNQTLRILASDDKGVPVEIDPPATQLGRDVSALVKDKYITGMSFSMANGFEDYDETEEAGKKIVNVNRFTCDEVTVTAIPAFADTSIEPKPDAPAEVGATQPRMGASIVAAANRLRLMGYFR